MLGLLEQGTGDLSTLFTQPPVNLQPPQPPKQTTTEKGRGEGRCPGTDREAAAARRAGSFPVWADLQPGVWGSWLRRRERAALRMAPAGTGCDLRALSRGTCPAPCPALLCQAHSSEQEVDPPSPTRTLALLGHPHVQGALAALWAGPFPLGASRSRAAAPASRQEGVAERSCFAY